MPLPPLSATGRRLNLSCTHQVVGSWVRTRSLSLSYINLSNVALSPGVYRGGCDVLVRSRLALGDGVTMQVTVRSKEETPVDVILASVG